MKKLTIAGLWWTPGEGLKALLSEKDEGIIFG
jgi:hypothetical protein